MSCLPCMMLGGMGMFLNDEQSVPIDQGPTVFMKTAGGFAPVTPRPDLMPFQTGLYTINPQGQYRQTTPYQLAPGESMLDKIGKVFSQIGAAAPAVAVAYQSFKKPPICVPPQVAKQDPVTGVWKCEVPSAGGDGSAVQTNWGTVALVGGGVVVAGLALYLILSKKK